MSSTIPKTWRWSQFNDSRNNSVIFGYYVLLRYYLLANIADVVISRNESNQLEFDAAGKNLWNNFFILAVISRDAHLHGFCEKRYCSISWCHASKYQKKLYRVTRASDLAEESSGIGKMDEHIFSVEFEFYSICWLIILNIRDRSFVEIGHK